MRGYLNMVLIGCLTAILSATTLAFPAQSATPAQTSPSATTAPTTTAMWAWYVADPIALAQDAQRRGVTHLFVHVTTGEWQPREKATLLTLAEHADARGITLWALGGQPSWTSNVRAARQWQAKALDLGIFAGSHLDIEPWALAGWAQPAKRARMVAQWSGTLRWLQRDSDLPMQVALPFWADQIAARGGGTMASHALTVADEVSVMSYRDSAPGVLGVGSVMLGLADQHEVPIRLAVETNELRDCPYCTFDGQNVTALRHAMDEIDAAAAVRTPWYQGLSVHDHAGWTELESASR